MLRPSFRLVPSVRIAVHAAVIGASLCALPAIAAENAGATDELEAVAIIGTRFSPRTVTDSAVPIDVLSQDDIRNNGYTDLAKVLSSLLPSFNSPHSSTPDGNTHVRVATLRGLAPDQTLVLINGKRRHSSSWVNTSGSSLGGGSVPTELNAIPTSAIERIEVLRDGAAAQYGSDAIAGVINIVLRKDLGYSLTGTYGATGEGDGDTKEASLTAGLPLGSDGVLHATLYYRDRNATDRALPDTRQQYFGRNGAGNPTALSSAFGSGVGSPPAGIIFDPREATIDRSSLWQFGDAALEERAFFVNAEKPLPIGAEGTQAYAFGGWNRSEASSAASFRRAGENNNVRAIFPDGYLPYIDTDSVNLSGGAGVRNLSGKWTWDLSEVVGHNELKYGTHNTLNASLGAASPTVFYDGKYAYTQATTNLDLTTELDVGLAAPIHIATGAEFRYEKYGISAGDPASYINGDVRVLDGPAINAVTAAGSQGFVGITPESAIQRNRHSYALYADSEFTPVDRLTLSLAGRFEDYSDFGTTLNGKATARLKLAGPLAARASLSTGFRAPSLPQQYYASISSRTEVSLDPNVPPRIIIQGILPVDSAAAQALGATALKPEESVNWSAGLTFEQGGLSATLDYYHIDIDDRILLSSNFSGAAVANLLASQGINAEAGRYFTNAADTRTQGVDASLRYRLVTDSAGRLTFTAGYNHNETKVLTTPRAAVPGVINTPIFNLQEIIRVERGQPRDNVQLGVSWDISRFSVTAKTVRYGEIAALAYTNQTPAQVAAIPAGSSIATQATTTAGAPAGNVDVLHILRPKWVTDLDIGVALTEHLQLSVGANNLFDVYPTRNIASTPTFSGNDTNGIFPYSSLSPFPYSGAFYYTRLSARF
ncbi:MAG: TonB-dependent receptor [Steroidobacteraceae bacterium]